MADGNSTARRKRDSRPAQEPSTPLSLEEIHAQYAGHWVLVQVTALNATKSPSAGHVLVHGSHRKVWKELARITEGWDGQKPLDHMYYVFSAGYRVTSFSTLLAAVDAARERDASSL